MSGHDDKWEKREARMRGSGTRGIKIEEFSIASPEHTRSRKNSLNLDSAFIKPDDLSRPRLRQTRGRTRITGIPEKQEEEIGAKADVKTKTKTETVKAQHVTQTGNRKLRFSSDEDDDDEDEDEDEGPEHNKGFDPRAPFTSSQKQADNYSKNEDDYNMDLGFEAEDEPRADSLEMEFEREPEEKMPTISVKQEEQHDEVPMPENDAKRRRGRPKKNEREKKVAVVTRRSRRIVDNPSLRQAHVPDPSVSLKVARPLRALGLASLLPYQPSADRNLEIVSLGAKSRGKQRPMVVDAERVITPSTRARRVQLNTLDVLQQFVEEHAPRPTQNEIVNENVVLTEFKAHLKYNLAYLMDQHASILDISQDIYELQRRKNEVRRQILELRKAHAKVGTELAKERKAHAENTTSHQQFMAMSNSLRQLKSAVSDGPEAFQSSKSELVHEKLAEVSRIFHPATGLQAQLRGINSALAETIRRSDHQ